MLHVSALLDPPSPTAGQDFTLALTIGNDGDRPAEGVYVATTGPWDQWTVLGIEPSGSFDQDAAGWHLVSDVQIPPGETRTIQVHVRADNPTQEQLTFAVREADASALPPPNVASPSDTSPSDASAGDTASNDTDQGDSAASDSSQSDVTPDDSASSDSSQADETPSDASASDSSQGDVAPSDAAASDSSQGDASMADSSQSDTSPGDVTPSDTPPSDSPAMPPAIDPRATNHSP
jgi:hypothetical protein